jgi:hypothetical protein
MQLSAAQVGAVKIGALRVRVLQVGALEIGRDKIGLGQHGTAEVRAGQRRVLKINLWQSQIRKILKAQIGPPPADHATHEAVMPLDDVDEFLRGQRRT